VSAIDTQPARKDTAYFNELLRKYKRKPDICSYCGAPISFREFVTQFEQEHKFCCKKCFRAFKQEKKARVDTDKCRSGTEEVIYRFLSTTYPNIDIRHNVNDLIPPYELDFVCEKERIAIEYNSIFHYYPKFGDKKKCRRAKLNDKKKKTLVCKELNWNMVRLWSEIGIYSKPALFELALQEIKKAVDLLRSSSCLGRCIDIIVSDAEEITVYKDEDPE